MKRPTRAALLVLLAILVAGACAAALHRVFVVRWLTYPIDEPVGDVAWYEPKEIVRGGEPQALVQAAPADAGLSADVLAEAATWAEAHASCALVVMRRGRIALEAYWRGGGASEPTNSFSLAKTLLGMLVGLAEQDGALALSDPIERFLPEWQGEPRGRVTVLDLLRMQSGLRYDDDRLNPFSDMVQVHLAADVLPTLLDVPLERPPGRWFRYSNIDSQILGLVLERATKRRFADYLSERLWAPLGTHDAAVWLDQEGGLAKTYCCVFATARDWALVGEMMRNGGRASGRQVVPADWIARMLEPSPLAREYGFHVWLRGGRGVPDHFVLDGKSKQRVYVIPELEAVIVRLGEDPEDWDELELPRLVATAVLDR